MKKILGTMVAFFILMTVGAGILIVPLNCILQVGPEDEYFLLIYGGIILLSGLIVGCTIIIIEEVREVKNIFLEKVKDDTNSSNTVD